MSVEERSSTPACPTCGGAAVRSGPLAPGGSVLCEEVGETIRCASCGDVLWRRGERLLPHRIAKAALPMWVAADRLRNHLRRLAIVRLGRIEGDCYFLPFIRMEGTTPEGDGTFTLLAASIGEERIERPFLPAADLGPFAPPEPGSAGGSGSGRAAIRILRPTLSKHALAARVRPLGWSLSREVELIHFPFWLMRVEDAGRIEGAWIDGIEGKLIHHRIRLARPVPPRGAAAALTALPAAAALAVDAASPVPILPAAAAWAVGAPLLYYAILRRWRG